MAIPSREQFIQEVKNFKKTHGKKLKEIFSKANHALVKEFFKNPIIHAYLKRDASKIHFLENNPDLSDITKKDEKTTSDYYELRLYKLMKNFFYFRSNATNAEFYTQSTPASTSQSFTSKIRKKHNTHMLYITEPKDVYQIRHFLNRHYYDVFLGSPTPSDLTNKKLRFILTPNHKDTHATFMCTILDEDSQRVLATVFINSEPKPDYTSYIEYRFNMPDYYYYPISSKIAEKNVDMSGVKFVDSIFSGVKDVCINKKIPFIDASHQLQTQEDDKNCAIYGLNFLKGIVEMLNQSAVSDRIYQLAKAVDAGDKNAELELANTFKETLKTYLPCYYDKNHQPKSHAEIKKFHLEQRWEIEGDLIDDDQALEKMILPEENNRTISEPTATEEKLLPQNNITPKIDTPNEKTPLLKNNSTTEAADLIGMICSEIYKPLKEEFHRLHLKRCMVSDAKKESYNKRITAFSETLNSVKLTLEQYAKHQDKKICKDDLIQHLNKLKNNPNIEKYKPYQKFLLKLLNAVTLILTGIIPGVIKYATSKRLFFSIDGKSKEMATQCFNKSLRF